MAEVYSLYAEIMNLNGWIQNLYDEDKFEVLVDSTNYPDILDSDDLHEILDNVAQKELKRSDYDSDEEYSDAVNEFWSDGTMQLERIDMNSNLYAWLIQWYGHNHKHNTSYDYILKHVRGAYMTNDALYFTHGLGYDVIDADLLNGTGDGNTKRKMMDFLNEKTVSKA